MSDSAAQPAASDNGSVRSRGTSKRGSSASGEGGESSDLGSQRGGSSTGVPGTEVEMSETNHKLASNRIPFSKKLGQPHSDIEQFPPEVVEGLAIEFEKRSERPFPAGTLMFVILFSYCWVMCEAQGAGGASSSAFEKSGPPFGGASKSAGNLDNVALSQYSFFNMWIYL